MATIVTLLACVGAFGMTTQASAQTVNSRPGAPQFLRDDLTRETAQQRYDEPDVQHPVEFEPQARGGLDRFHLLAAAERSAGGGEGAAVLRRQTSRPKLPNWRRNSKTP